MEEPKKRSFYDRITSIYRLTVMNDFTFEEKISVKLSPLGLSVLIGSIVIFLIIGVTSLIAFTPLREYIPGYADVNVDRKVRTLLNKADSLERDADLKTKYITNINMIISGKDTSNLEMLKKDTAARYEHIRIRPSAEDSVLRKQIESQDRYSLTFNTGKFPRSDIADFFFFTPIKGIITNSFNAKEEHFGVDIAAPENEAIKAVLDGTVTISAWTSETGYIIQIQHENNLISVYKHNSTLLKKTGQSVKAGEVIAIIGNSGEVSTGPHLHFELWYNGNPVDPQEYMIF